jgi:hypothetical protein
MNLETRPDWRTSFLYLLLQEQGSLILLTGKYLELELNMRPTVSLIIGLLFGAREQILKFSPTLSCFLMYGALSDEKTGLYFAVNFTLWSESRMPLFYILLSNWEPSNLEGQVPVFISTRNMVAQL